MCYIALASATRARNSTAGLFNIQFHSGLRRNETSGLGLIELCYAYGRDQKQPSQAGSATKSQTPTIGCSGEAR